MLQTDKSEVFYNIKFNSILLILFFIILYLVVLCPNVTLSKMVESPVTVPTNIELSVNQMRLGQICILITKQTGYKILLEPLLSDILISGVYSNISIEKFFKRVLKDKNLVFEFNSLKNIIKIDSFSAGSRSLGDTISNSNESIQLVSLDDLDLKSKTSYSVKRPRKAIGQIEIGDGMTLNYINDLNKKQAQQNMKAEVIESSLLGLDLTINELNIFHSVKNYPNEFLKNQ